MTSRHGQVHEGLPSEALLETEVRTTLVALNDPKVSPTPSPNRFTFTLVAFLYRVRLNRICAAMESVMSVTDARP
jgi:hypothetical protein